MKAAIVLDPRHQYEGKMYKLSVKVSYKDGEKYKKHYFDTGHKIKKHQLKYILGTPTEDLIEIKEEVTTLHLKAIKWLRGKTKFSKEAFDSYLLADSVMKVEEDTPVTDLLEQKQTKIYKEGRIKHAELVRAVRRKIDKVYPGLRLYEVTLDWLEDFAMRTGLSDTTISMYLKEIKSIDHRRKNGHNVWSQFKLPSTVRRNNALYKHQVDIIFDMHYDHPKIMRALHFWQVMYLCNGIYPSTLLRMQDRHIRKDIITISRKKTERTSAFKRDIVISLTPELNHLIALLRSDDENNPYVFGILDQTDSEAQKTEKIKNFIKYGINKYLTKPSADLGLDFNLTTSIARHSFANVLYQAGESMEIISEMLGHTSIDTTRHYVESFTVDKYKAAGAKLR